LADIQNKLDDLRYFSTSTASIFNEEIQLTATLSAAIDSIGKGILSGGMYTPGSGDMEPWLEKCREYLTEHPTAAHVQAIADAQKVVDYISSYTNSDGGPIPQGMLDTLQANAGNSDFADYLADHVSALDLADFLGEVNSTRIVMASNVTAGVTSPSVLTQFDSQYSDLLASLGASISLAACGMDPERLVAFTDQYKAIFTSEEAAETPLPLLMSMLIARGAWPSPFLTGVDSAILEAEGAEGIEHWLPRGNIPVVDPEIDPIMGVQPEIRDPMYGVYKSASIFNTGWLLDTFSGNELTWGTINIENPYVLYDNDGNPYTVSTQMVTLDSGIWAHMHRGTDDASFAWLQQAFATAQIEALNQGLDVPILQDVADGANILKKMSDDYNSLSFWEKNHHQILAMGSMVLGLAAIVVPGPGWVGGGLLVASSLTALVDAGMYWQEGEKGLAITEAVIVVLPFVIGGVVKLVRMTMGEIAALRAGEEVALADGTMVTLEDIADSRVLAAVKIKDSTDPAVVSTWWRGVPTKADIAMYVDLDSTGHLTPDSIKALSDLATMNPGSRYVVLGGWFPNNTSYEQVAFRARGTYYDLGEGFDYLEGQLMRFMGKDEAIDELWKINESCLEQQVREGKTFYFTSNPNLRGRDTFGWLEFQYLSKYFKFVEIGDGVWKGVPL